jgi:hypothetical protein
MPEASSFDKKTTVSEEKQFGVYNNCLIELYGWGIPKLQDRKVDYKSIVLPQAGNYPQKVIFFPSMTLSCR